MLVIHNFMQLQQLPSVADLQPWIGCCVSVVDSVVARHGRHNRDSVVLALPAQSLAAPDKQFEWKMEGFN